MALKSKNKSRVHCSPRAHTDIKAAKAEITQVYLAVK